MEREERNLRRRAAASLSALLIFAATLSAQGTTGTIRGTVADASGAAIPEAKIQVKNVNTGALQNVTSDGQGRYAVENLSVG